MRSVITIVGIAILVITIVDIASIIIMLVIIIIIIDIIAIIFSTTKIMNFYKVLTNQQHFMACDVSCPAVEHQ